MKTQTIGFIGGGRITKIILKAFENKGISFTKIAVTDTNPDVLNSLKQKFPKITITPDKISEVVNSDVLFIALHPPVLMETISKIKDQLRKDTLVVSLAPKLTIDKMSSDLGGFPNIARLNPSASTIVNKGVNPIAFSAAMDSEKRKQLLELFHPLGSTPVVDESKIEAYAVISAMGHTYFFFQLEKMKELALTFGMDENEAQTAITEMLWGTTETLFKSGLSYPEVADLVPVKPLGEVEEVIKGYFDQYLTGIYAKIKP
jgi:pyrroline-5-carboxylate reductase